jgi:hypothetical protein
VCRARGGGTVLVAGETKSRLRPQPYWQAQPEYDEGIYVKEEVARQMGLEPTTTGEAVTGLERSLASCGDLSQSGRQVIWDCTARQCLGVTTRP